MHEVTYLIVGGGVAGTTAAETIRRSDPRGSITIISDEPHRFYSRIMLSKPNFFLEKIPFDSIWLKTESWYREQRIDLVLGRTATKLDAGGKVLTLDDGREWHYQKLLLAIGGDTCRLAIPGTELPGVYYLRTLDDATGIIAAVKEARHGIAIGGGFIGFEMCEMMRMAGLRVTLVIREGRFWEHVLDETSSTMIEGALERGGVRILHNTEVQKIVGKEKIEGVHLSTGVDMACEIAIIGIGVICPIEPLKQAGVAVNRGILANEYLETNLPDIWVAGDAAEFNDLVLRERIQLGNWVNAQMQGRIAGANMTGKRMPFKMVSFYTTQGFGITIAFVGDVRPLPDRAIVSRGSYELGSYARLLLSGDRLIGATLINRTHEMAAIVKLIERGADLRAHAPALKDPQIPLANLLAQRI